MQKENILSSNIVYEHVYLYESRCRTVCPASYCTVGIVRAWNEAWSSLICCQVAVYAPGHCCMICQWTDLSTVALGKADMVHRVSHQISYSLIPATCFMRVHCGVSKGMQGCIAKKSKTETRCLTSSRHLGSQSLSEGHFVPFPLKRHSTEIHLLAWTVQKVLTCFHYWNKSLRCKEFPWWVSGT